MGQEIVHRVSSSHLHSFGAVPVCVFISTYIHDGTFIPPSDKAADLYSFPMEVYDLELWLVSV